MLRLISQRKFVAPKLRTISSRPTKITQIRTFKTVITQSLPAQKETVKAISIASNTVLPTSRMSTTITTQKRNYSAGAAGITQEEIAERVLNIVRAFHKMDHTKEVKPETHFANELGLDSLDVVEVVMAVEDEFCVEVPDVEAEKMQTPADVIKFIMAHPTAK